jgi:hypothetical protein
MKLIGFCDCRSNILGMRTLHKDAFIEKHGVKLGFMSGFVKVMTSFFVLTMPKGLVIVLFPAVIAFK